MRIESIQPGIPHIGGNQQAQHPINVPTTSFKDTMATFIDDVNKLQKESSLAQQNFISGKITDVHQVITKGEEANVAFNMLMELRNKSMDGLGEIMRTRL